MNSAGSRSDGKIGDRSSDRRRCSRSEWHTIRAKAARLNWSGRGRSDRKWYRTAERAERSGMKCDRYSWHWTVRVKGVWFRRGLGTSAWLRRSLGRGTWMRHLRGVWLRRRHGRSEWYAVGLESHDRSRPAGNIK